MRKWMPILVASFLAGPAWTDDGEKVEDATLPDAEGNKHTLYERKEAKAIVLLFLGTQCPASNRYPLRLADLHKTYGPRGAVFFGVYSNAMESPESIAKHARESGIPFPVLVDRDQELADRLRVRTIPCTIVVDASRTLRYRGRIDDNKNEQLVKDRWLRDALEAVLAGKAVPVPATEPVGCKIQRKLAEKKETGVTYAEHIAPILYRNCLSCHRAGQIGPFPLLTYEDARDQAENIRDVVKERRMPPWKPSEHGLFRGERTLQPEEIDLVDRWVKDGAPQGDLARAPAPPKFAEGWILGEPDLVLTAPEYEVSARGDDEYRCYVLPTKLGEDRWVSAVEMRPGNTNVVHHILGYVDTSGRAAQLDAEDADPGYRSSGTGPRFEPAGEMGGWAPGTQPYALPDGIGRLLPKGATVVLETHYHKNGSKEKDRTRIGIHFAKSPVKQRLQWFSLVNWWFRIPANERRHKIVAEHVVRGDLTLRAIAPHMHLLGREVTVEAELPDRTRKVLIRIPDWDFNWQDVYQFQKPLFLPKGTKLTATTYYDNSDSNPNNPNRPPKAVSWGEQTTDEMCLVFLSYTREGDEGPDEDEW